MYGPRVHRAVIEAGARVTGVTAHFVDEEYDRGRIIAQWPVPVFPGDDAGTLAARVLRVEHMLYPRVVQTQSPAARPRSTTARCACQARRSMCARAFTLLAHEESRLAENIELTLGC